MLQQVALALVTLVLSGFSASASPFEAACEEVLQERLFFPKTYKRVAAEQIGAPLSRDEYVAWLEKDEPSNSTRIFMLQTFDSGRTSVTRFMMRMDYTAENRAGKTVAEIAICEYVGEDISGAAYYSVSINGQTKNDYLAAQIAGLPK